MGEGGFKGPLMVVPAKRGKFINNDVIDSLRINDAQWHALLDELDREASVVSGAQSGRRDERLPYRNLSILLVTMQFQDGHRQRFRVRTHNISKSGLAFLHGNFVYVGTRAELVLVHRVEGVKKLYSTVRRCEHLTGKIHHIGVEFDLPIEDVGDYLLADLDAGNL